MLRRHLLQHAAAFSFLPLVSPITSARSSPVRQNARRVSRNEIVLSASISVPDDFAKIAAGLGEQAIARALQEFVENNVGRIAHEQEAKINANMAALAPGADFFGFIVEAVDATHLTLQRTLESLPVSYPIFDHFPPTMQKIAGLKISLLQMALKIEKHVNLTDSRRAVVDVVEVVEITMEVELAQSSYTIRVGGGFDHLRAALEQYLVEVDLKAPPLRFHGFLATSGGGGLVISVHSGLPVPIPLGTSCFALTGVGLLYGERFAPWVSGNKPTESTAAIAALGKATAEDYVGWAQRPDLNKWVPVDPDLRIFGLNADVGDLGTAGRIIELQEAGLTYLSHGPTLIFGGRLNFLELPIAQILGAIDIPSKSMFLSLSSSTLEVSSEIKIAGSIALSASLEDQTRTWAALGGYEMKGCSLDILQGLISLNGGCRIVPFQGAAIRGAARVETEGTVLGLGGGYSFSIGLTGTIGWNPMEVGGQLDVGGSIWITVWGVKLGAGIEAHLLLQISKPLELRLWGEVSLDLPWPLSPVSFPVEVFDFHIPVLAPPLPGFALQIEDPLPFYYAPSGLQGKLGVARADVWPDVIFDLPFRRSAKGPGLIVNRAAYDGVVIEAGVTTTHEITRIEIMKVDATTGLEMAVAGLCAAWMGSAAAGRTDRTSRLAIPSNDPLAWLQFYDHSQPNSAAPIERVVFQTFGAGRDEVFAPASGTPASVTVEGLRAASSSLFRLVNLPWAAPYPRALTVLRVSFDIGMEILGTWVTYAVRQYDIRLVAKDAPNVRANGVDLPTTKIRDLDRGFAEWAAIVEPAPADRRDPVQLDGLERVLTIAAVGYTLDATELDTPGTQTVLQPGIYRLHLEGHSDARYPGANQPHVDWVPLVREFRVVPPDTLRPYLRYATFGDERIFGVAHGGWNPNPSGRGFGHYLGHLGVARARVGYLSKIYDRLWVAAKRDDTPVRTDVTRCVDGSVAGGKLGAAWPDQTGAPATLEEELRFALPNTSGDYEIAIYRSDTIDGNNLFKIDGWSYRVSKFRSPTEHLKPAANTLNRAFGPFGTRALQIAALPDLPVPFDIDAVPAATLRSGWALPRWLHQEHDFSDTNLGLSFLRLFDWSGFFDAGVKSPEERITSRPPTPSADLLMDRTSRPLGLLLRTAEPVDWRRVEATFAQGTTDYDRRFGVRCFPSPDGCSAVLVALANGLPVRLPRGRFGVRMVFHYRVDDLPSLVDAGQLQEMDEVFTFTFDQIFGKPWDA